MAAPYRACTRSGHDLMAAPYRACIRSGHDLMAAPYRACTRSGHDLMAAPYRACIRSGHDLMAAPYRACIRSAHPEKTRLRRPTVVADIFGRVGVIPATCKGYFLKAPLIGCAARRREESLHENGGMHYR